MVEGLEFAATEIGPGAGPAFTSPDCRNDRCLRLKPPRACHENGFVQRLDVAVEEWRASAGEIDPHHDQGGFGTDDSGKVPRIRKTRLIEQLPVVCHLKEVVDPAAAEATGRSIDVVEVIDGSGSPRDTRLADRLVMLHVDWCVAVIEPNQEVGHTNGMQPRRREAPADDKRDTGVECFSGDRFPF